jgi:hypothetical protein
VGAKEKEWENWWEQAFNKTASSIDISAPGKAPQSSLNTRDATSKPLTSGPSFISEREIVQQSSDIFLSVKPLSDQELFRICEGRTAHKGARSCMAGKLKRAKQIGSGLPEIGDKYSDSDVHGISSNDKNNPCITSYSPKISRKHRRHSKNDGKMKKAKRKK